MMAVSPTVDSTTGDSTLQAVAAALPTFAAGLRVLKRALAHTDPTTTSAASLPLKPTGAHSRTEWEGNQELRDAASGLFTRRALGVLGTTLLEHACRTERPISLILLDLPELAETRHIYGPQGSQQILMKFAGVLRQVAGRKGLAMRMGKTRFAVLLPDTDHAGATGACSAVLHAGATLELEVAGRKVLLTPQIQIRCPSGAAMSLEEVFTALEMELESRCAQPARVPRLAKCYDDHLNSVNSLSTHA